MNDDGALSTDNNDKRDYAGQLKFYTSNSPSVLWYSMTAAFWAQSANVAAIEFATGGLDWYKHRDVLGVIKLTSVEVVDAGGRVTRLIDSSG
jgi:hypothetical protein